MDFEDCFTDYECNEGLRIFKDDDNNAVEPLNSNHMYGELIVLGHKESRRCSNPHLWYPVGQNNTSLVLERRRYFNEYKSIQEVPKTTTSLSES